MEPVSRLNLSYPLYALGALPSDDFVVTGGGGRLKSGVPNACDLISLNEATGTLTPSASVELPDAGVALSVHGCIVHIIIDQGVKMFHVKEASIKPASRFFYDIRVSSSVEQTALALSGDGRTLALADDDGLVCVLALPSFELLFRGSIHTQGITDISLSPDGCLACSTARDRLAVLWDTRSGQVVQTVRTISAGDTEANAKRPAGKPSIRVLRFGASDGLLFAGESSKEGGWVSVWRHQGRPGSTSEPYIACSFSRACSDALTGLAVDRTGRLIAVSSSEGHITLLQWDGVTLSRVWSSETFLGNFRNSNSPHALPVTGMCFSASGRFLVAASADRTISVWDNHARSRAGMLPWIFAIGFALIFVFVTIWLRIHSATPANISRGDVHKLTHTRRNRFQKDQLDKLQSVTMNDVRTPRRYMGRKPRGLPWRFEPDDICIVKAAENVESMAIKFPLKKDRKPMRRSVKRNKFRKEHSGFRRGGFPVDAVGNEHKQDGQRDEKEMLKTRHPKTDSFENMKQSSENASREHDTSVLGPRAIHDISEKAFGRDLLNDSARVPRTVSNRYAWQQSIDQTSAKYKTHRKIVWKEPMEHKAVDDGKIIRMAERVCEKHNDSILEKDSVDKGNEDQRQPNSGNSRIDENVFVKKSISAHNRNSFAQDSHKLAQWATMSGIEEDKDVVSDQIEKATLHVKNIRNLHANDLEDDSRRAPRIIGGMQLEVCPRQIRKWDRLVRNWGTTSHTGIDESHRERETKIDAVQVGRRIHGKIGNLRDAEDPLTNTGSSSSQTVENDGETKPNIENSVLVCKRKRLFRRPTKYFANIHTSTGFNLATWNMGSISIRNQICVTRKKKNEVDTAMSGNNPVASKDDTKSKDLVTPPHSPRKSDNTVNFNSLAPPSSSSESVNDDRDTMNNLDTIVSKTHIAIRQKGDRNKPLITPDMCFRREWVHWEKTDGMTLADVERKTRRRREYHSRQVRRH